MELFNEYCEVFRLYNEFCQNLLLASSYGGVTIMLRGGEGREGKVSDSHNTAN